MCNSMSLKDQKEHLEPPTPTWKVGRLSPLKLSIKIPFMTQRQILISSVTPGVIVCKYTLELPWCLKKILPSLYQLNRESSDVRLQHLCFLLVLMFVFLKYFSCSISSMKVGIYKNCFSLYSS